MSLPIALQLYSVRAELADDFYGTLEQVAKLGYDGVEFAGLYGQNPKDVRRALDGLGLRAISAHVGYDVIKPDPEDVFFAYAECGCDYIALPWMAEEHRPGGAQWDQALSDIKTWGKWLTQHGMKLLYHNHDFEFGKVGDKYIIDEIYSQTCPECLQTEFDVCWVSVAGEDPAKYIRKYAGRSPVVHLKDYVMNGRSKGQLYDLIDGGKPGNAANPDSGFDFRPVGYGTVDIPAVLAAANDAGAKWVVVEQDRSTDRAPIESAKMSIDYLRGLEK